MIGDLWWQQTYSRSNRCQISSKSNQTAAVGYIELRLPRQKRLTTCYLPWKKEKCQMHVDSIALHYAYTIHRRCTHNSTASSASDTFTDAWPRTLNVYRLKQGWWVRDTCFGARCCGLYRLVFMFKSYKTVITWLVDGQLTTGYPLLAWQVVYCCSI